MDPSTLYNAGLVKKKSLVKILAQGSLDKALKVKAHHFSKKAIELIEKAGGVAEKINFTSSVDTKNTKKSGKTKK